MLGQDIHELDPAMLLYVSGGHTKQLHLDVHPVTDLFGEHDESSSHEI